MKITDKTQATFISIVLGLAALAYILLLPSCSKKDAVMPLTIITVKTDSTKTVKLSMAAQLKNSTLPSSIVCAGSNLVHGTDSATSFPAQLQTILLSNGINNATVYNKGIDWAQVDYLNSLIYTDLTPNFIQPGKDIAVAWEIAEDVYDNRTGNDTYMEHFRMYCQDLQANGWTVIVVTVPYRNISFLSGGDYTPSGFDSLEYDSTINSLNDSLRLNWQSFSSGLADVADSLTHYDPVYYQTDHYNLTPAGNLLVAKTVYNTLQNN
jgi:spore coat protein U-like protein